MEWWQVAVVLVVGVGLIGWRWNSVSARRLTDEVCRGLAESVVADLVELAPDADVPVRVTASYWRNLGLDGRTAVELARWMTGHGYVRAEGWGLMDVLLGAPPTALAATPRTMARALSGAGPTVINSSGGPVNYGSGTQLVSGGDLTVAARYRDLADAVRRDAHRLEGLERSQALAAADTLVGVADGTVDVESPVARGTVDWLRARSDEAVGGALGSALWVATSAVLSSFFG